ncbi:Detected protein of confused Function [Hibiscus syriacus]|uniref:beta-fructofuranosidase n=1 Tax=Hibiscus syriacus TaxID=106335 RepID=A0A6A3AFV3_HIBSY|nr:Detected protein of confused Function [Hibiscus syriacus]
MEATTFLHSSARPRPRRPLSGCSVIFGSVVFLILFLTLITNQSPGPSASPGGETEASPSARPRGIVEGVSAKSNPCVLDKVWFNWTNAMFYWQRSAYHFQPQMNWMNGPFYHEGWYHLFYQYNPDSAPRGNITWGRAVSSDLIHWFYLPLATIPDQWYDMNGVWTGSATLLPDGRIVMLYTGSAIESVQVQNLAYPANLSDPLLVHWFKYPGNPVIVPPTGIEFNEFRDPTTAWFGPDGLWRIAVGSRCNSTTGMSLVYQTTNFTDYELLDGVLHAVPGTGTHLLQWPVEEVESLRLVIEVGSVEPLDIGTANQLDILAEFGIESSVSNTTDEVGDCGEGAVDISSYGPFGILVIADVSLSEQTPVYFRPLISPDDSLKTYFCADETRSSEASDVLKRVDHSVIKSRIYPTKAIYGGARIFLFNNASGVNVKATLKIWEMDSAFIRPFPFEERL